MKNLILIASLILTAFTAQASRLDNMAWSEIVANRNFDVRFPSWGGAYINNLCANESTFQTLKPIAVCNEYQRIEHRAGKGDSWTEIVCVDKEVRNITVPAGENRTRCSDYRRGRKDEDGSCVAYEKYYYQFPLTHEVSVYGRSFGKDRDPQLVGTKLFTIPACK